MQALMAFLYQCPPSYADYRATLAEMYRVLKAGGRAAFSEPGDEHSKSPESIMAVEQFGAIEKDIILPEIHQLPRKSVSRV